VYLIKPNAIIRRSPKSCRAAARGRVRNDLEITRAGMKIYGSLSAIGYCNLSGRRRDATDIAHNDEAALYRRQADGRGKTRFSKPKKWITGSRERRDPARAQLRHRERPNSSSIYQPLLCVRLMAR